MQILIFISQLVDLKKAIMIALLHDYAESYISDVPHPIKKQFPLIEEELNKAENNIVSRTVSGLKNTLTLRLKNILANDGGEITVYAKAQIVDAQGLDGVKQLFRRHVVQTLAFRLSGG